MIADFLKKKENVFIILVALVSGFCVILGFVFLFFQKTGFDGPKTIPNSVTDISWAGYRSDLIGQKIEYPEHLYISEQKDETGVGITVAEFEPTEFLTYFSNQNHFSVYPSGIDAPFFYAKTRDSDFTSGSGQEYRKTEYLTVSDEVWAVMLVPKITPRNWQPNGFVWIQARLQDREALCMSGSGIVADTVDCNPYAGEKTVYDGTISGQFLRFGYEIVNRNTFKSK